MKIKLGIISRSIGSEGVFGKKHFSTKEYGIRVQIKRFTFKCGVEVLIFET